MRIEDSSVDIIVSTNTLHWLPNADVIRAVSNFIRILKSDGLLCLQATVDLKMKNRIIEMIEEHFLDIEISYYGNLVSRIYEYIVRIKIFPNSIRKMNFVKKYVTYPLSIIERYTDKNCNNTHLYVFAKNKNHSQANNDFDLAKFAKITENIYQVSPDIRMAHDSNGKKKS